MNLNIPYRILTLRTRMGLNQAAFAHRMGCSMQSVHRWETGKSFPLPMYIAKLERLERQAQKKEEHP